jgi:hypothetical protein
MRIIGVELRAQYVSRAFGSQREELGIAACQIELAFPDDELVSKYVELSGTIHTDVGDFNFGAGQAMLLQAEYFYPRVKAHRFRVRQ